MASLQSSEINLIITLITISNHGTSKQNYQDDHKIAQQEWEDLWDLMPHHFLVRLYESISG